MFSVMNKVIKGDARQASKQDRKMTVVVRKKESELKGRAAKFKEIPARILASIPPDPELARQFVPLPTQDSAIQVSTSMSHNEVNTKSIDFASTGMNHTEGGWPRDMSVTDKEQKARYRKKVIKDESYVRSMLQLTQRMEHYIKQNNAIDIYEMYFEDDKCPAVAEPEPIKTVNVIRDPHGGQRMVTSVSFSPEGGNKVAAAYSSSKFMAMKGNIPKSSYIWDLNKSYSPEMKLEGPSWLQCIQYNAKDANIIAAGLYNGQLSWWDTRSGWRPIETTRLEISHTQTVTEVTWMALKARTELFTVSVDGQVLWWDTRKLSQPTDSLVLDPMREDPPNIERALSATAVEYEVSMPTKLLVATEQGQVVACNRRARNPPDRISLIYNAHIAPIYAIQRNPFLLKNFVTIGDWTVKLWTEDFKEYPILWTKPTTSQLRDGCWSTTRSSVVFTVRLDGVLDAWDLLTSWNSPIADEKVCDEGLEVVGAQAGGRVLVCGSQLGTLSLLHLPARLVNPSDKYEKSAFTALLDRETRRERVLEARNKEQRARERSRAGGARFLVQQSEEQIQEDPIKKAEEEYLKRVAELKLEFEEEVGIIPPVAVEVTGADETDRQVDNTITQQSGDRASLVENEEAKSLSSSGSAER